MPSPWRAESSCPEAETRYDRSWPASTAPWRRDRRRPTLDRVTHSRDVPQPSPDDPDDVRTRGAPEAVDAVDAVDAVADRYVDEFAALDPVAATLNGITGHDDEVTDYSPDGFAARAELDRRALAALDDAVPRDERERTARAAMRERLRTAIERHEAAIPQTEVNVLGTPLHALRQVLDLMPTHDERAWRAISARLAGMPAALESYRRTLTEFAREGQVAARRQVLAVADQCAAWTGDDDVFGGLVARADVGAPLRGELDRMAAAASASVTEFSRFLREDLAPQARERDAAGRGTYAVASRHFLGAEIDLDETYEWGLGELDRIEREMAGVAELLTGSPDIDEAVRVLDSDPARRIEGAEAFRDWMQGLADRTIAELHGRHFDIPEPVRRIECRIAPTRDGAIYYSPPSEDFSRPGSMWWSVPPDVTVFPTWRDVTSVYHEGVPGHHLQLGNAAARSDVLNRWQRVLGKVSGNAEGWALYAERLMDELGGLDDPGARLGMLNAQRIRAARVVVDIGMHLELLAPPGTGASSGQRWTPELGMAFLREHTRMSEGFLRFELNRYLGLPGQAPSYKVGERIWLEAREEARRRKGAAFDLTAFHRAALDLGLLGLDPLREALARL